MYTVSYWSLIVIFPSRSLGDTESASFLRVDFLREVGSFSGKLKVMAEKHGFLYVYQRVYASKSNMRIHVSHLHIYHS